MILSVLLSFLLSTTFLPTPSVIVLQDDPPIIVIPDNPFGDENRSPSIISGYYNSSTEILTLLFSSPLGMVDIRFDNLTNGDYYETSVNGSGSVVIPLSFSSGSWQVTFSLADGTVYSTSFVI